jgi:hypothetical protein
MGYHSRRLELLVGKLLGPVIILSLLLAPPMWDGAGPLSVLRSSHMWAPSVPAAQAPETRAPDQNLPADVSPDWWSTVQEDIRRQEYHITWQDVTYLSDVPAAYQAPNRAHNLRTYFTPTGVRVIPRVRGGDDWECGLALSGYGALGDVQPVGGAELTPSANRVEYRYESGSQQISEWYVNDEGGLEHGFVVAARPASSLPTASLVLDLALTGGLTPGLVDGGAAVEFATSGGVSVLRYGDLSATDATGRQLPVRLDLAQSEIPRHALRITIDDANATYPLTLTSAATSTGDLSPTASTGLSTSADWTAEGDQEGAQFGYSVSTAGDVNGDGYSDVIVGAYTYDNGEEDEGAAFVFYGSADGLRDTPAWTDESDQPFALFGGKVSTAGDVDGDGYADVMVRAHLYDTATLTDTGKVYVYYGSPSGLSTTPDWTAHGDGEDDHFGAAIGTAGDVDGDGYDDIIIGATGHDEGSLSDAGRAYVYFGDSSGLSTGAADWTDEGDQQEAYFGGVSTAGDVNGDGYSDIIVGATHYDSGEQDEGRAYVYYGSPAGPSTTPDWMAESNQKTALFGTVSTAGDVNGDGFSDVIIGAYAYDNGEGDEGVVFGYYGSETGLGANGTPGNADWTAESDEAGAFYGIFLSTAGDVNGDGYGDVIVGAYLHSTDALTYTGQAYVYHGSVTGLDTAADWTVEGDQAYGYLATAVDTAGDVNGDGYSDVIIGAIYYDNGEEDEGQAYVFHGGADGLSETSAWTGGGVGADAYYGASVSTAGDVNGDGYADVIVGAPGYDGGMTGEGAAFVYHGSPTGLAAAGEDWRAEGNRPNIALGSSVCTAGDVNGDGYADIIVGAPEYDLLAAPRDRGAALVWYGSATGLGIGGTPLNADWKVEGANSEDFFGSSVCTAGDVNGDGYADVIVGVPGYKGGNEEDEGIAYVYHGTAAGLSLTANWSVESNQAGVKLGEAVSTAGDVNGDGYADVILGAHKYDGNDGRVFVYHGSATGLSPAADWTVKGEQDGAHLGYAASTAGDVNGDGYSDVIVGAPHYADGMVGEGAAFVYRGSATGLSAAANWMTEGGQSNGSFGASVSTAGDVNGDGYSDVIVGAPEYDHGEEDEGRVFAYLGSSTGLSTGADWSAESNHPSAFFGHAVFIAGDVNGDGYSDVIVGADRYGNSGTADGAASLYYGNGGDGLDLLPRQVQVAGPTLIPIVVPGKSGSATGVKLRLTGRTPLGREDVKLQWQVAPLGTPFSATDVITGGSVIWTDVLTTGVTIERHVTGLSPGTPYHWRARLLYRPGNRLGLAAGRWFYGPAYSGTETSFRTEDGAITGLEARNDSPTILGDPTTFSAGADQVYVSYTWDFGDGAAGSGRVVTHTYPSTGTYTAIVTGTNTVDVAVAQTNVTVDYVYVYVPLVLESYVSHFRGPWEVEDNDTASSANGPLASGQDYYGYPDDANDYFGVYMPEAGTLTIDLTSHVGQGVQVQLFYQSTSVMVTYDWNPPYHIVYTGSAGWYYVRIYTASGYTGATPYTLRVTYP